MSVLKYAIDPAQNHSNLNIDAAEVSDPNSGLTLPNVTAVSGILDIIAPQQNSVQPIPDANAYRTIKTKSMDPVSNTLDTYLTISVQCRSTPSLGVIRAAHNE